MRTPRFKSLVALTALALLAALGLALAEAALVHTDDGCALETHCLACRFALSATALAPAGVTIEPALVACAWVTPRAPAQAVHVCSHASLSRGPPHPLAELS